MRFSVEDLDFAFIYFATFTGSATI